MSTFDQRMMLEVAKEKAAALRDDLGHVLAEMVHWEFAGSVRRESHTVGDLDLIVVPKKVTVGQGDLLHEQKGDTASLKEFGWPEWVTVKDRKAYGWYEPHGAHRVMMDAFWCPEASVGAMRWFLTGPPDLNVFMRQRATANGWLLNQYGLWEAVPSPTAKYPERVAPGARIDTLAEQYDQQEHMITTALRMRFIPPKQRDEWRRFL